MSNPMLYLGQRAVQVGVETEKLCRSEKYAQSPSLFADSRSSYVASKGLSVLDINMPHLFSYPSDDSPTVDAIIQALLHKLEQCDNVSGLGVVADFSSGAGSSLSSALISELKDLAPHIRIHSVFITPPNDTLQGINVLNGVMSLQTSLEAADSVMIRGVDDALTYVKEKIETPSIQDACAAIAADLYCALGPKKVSFDHGAAESSDWCSQGGSVFTAPFLQEHSPDISLGALYCWPSGVCSAKNKICDVRSSLWRMHYSHSRPSKHSTQASKAAAKYSPIRAMAANMHSLHITSGLREGPDDGLTADLRNHTVQAATLGHIAPEQELYIPGRERSQHKMVLSSGFSCADFASTEVSTLLNWACPGVHFPQHLGRHTFRDRSSGQTVTQGQVRKNTTGVSNFSSYVRDASRSGDRSVSSIRTNKSTAASRSKAGDNRMRGSDQQESVAALSFLSPYALDTVVEVSKRAQSLFSMNAYIERYADVGVEHEDFEQCLNYVSDVLLNTLD